MHCYKSAIPSQRKRISESPFGGRKSLIGESESLIYDSECIVWESKRIVCDSILNVSFKISHITIHTYTFHV